MKLLLAIAIPAVILTGCSKSLDSKSEQIIYPLALGNQWTYNTMMTWTHGDPIRVDTLKGNSGAVILTVEQVDTIRPGVFSYTMRGIDVGTPMIDGPIEAAYLNLPEGMYRLWRKELTSFNAEFAMPRQVAYPPEVVSAGPSPAWLPSSNWLRSAFADPAGPIVCQAALPADTLPLILAYPQHIGEVWTLHDSGGGYSYRIDKVIEGRETITTPAGHFDCWRIRFVYWRSGAPTSEIDYVEYVSVEGLIRRRFVSGPPNNLWVTSCELTSFTLH